MTWFDLGNWWTGLPDPEQPSCEGWVGSWVWLVESISLWFHRFHTQLTKSCMWETCQQLEEEKTDQLFQEKHAVWQENIGFSTGKGKPGATGSIHYNSEHYITLRHWECCHIAEGCSYLGSCKGFLLHYPALIEVMWHYWEQVSFLVWVPGFLKISDTRG